MSGDLEHLKDWIGKTETAEERASAFRMQGLAALLDKPDIPKEGDPVGPMGAKGLGEHVLIPTAPAILNAIRDASGAEIDQLPALPHRVLAAIKQAQGDNVS